ncbi:MAG: exopolysaccharide transport family protein, partial [Alphaproteobacteria bacterium]|nr:exopolysaccharide transport family protein [Alphaproteobacteria bacterium]
MARQELPAAMSPSAPNGHDTDLSGFFKILKRSALPIVLLTLAAMLAAIFYLALTSASYSASTTILVDPRSRKIVSEEITQGGLTSDLALVESQVPIIASDEVLGRVVDQFKLTDDPEFKFYTGSSLISRVKSLIRGVRPTPEPRAYAIERLARAMKIHRAQKTYILEVEISATSPVQAARLSSAIAEAYIAEQLKAKTDEARQANALIDSRLDQLRRDVQRAETRVDEFKKANKIVSSEGGFVSEQQLGKLNTELATARAVAAEARARRSEVQAVLKTGARPDTLPDAVNSALVQKLREQYAQVSRRAASLGAQFQNRHPIMIDIRSQQREISAQIASELKRIVSASKTEAEIAATREAEILQALETAKSQVARSNTAKIKLGELEREAHASRELLGAFLIRAKETQEQQNLTAANARIVSRASVPSYPSWPKPLLVLLLASLGGLGLGIASALTRDHFDTSVGQHATHVTQTTLPTLSTLPRLRAAVVTDSSLIGKARDALALASFIDLSDIMQAVSHAQTRSAHRFRQGVLRLLNGILTDSAPGNPRTILMVSPASNAGTTSTTLALGYSAALAGERVLLVDADSNHPQLSTVFGGNRSHSERVMLDNKTQLQRLITVDADSGLEILPIALADLRLLKTQQR